MKRSTLNMIAIFVFIPVISLATGNNGQVVGPIVRGLYIGMEADTARKIAWDILHEHCDGKIDEKFKSKDRNNEIILSCSKYFVPIVLTVDKQDKVIQYSLPISIFGAGELSLEEFAQAFINAYGIPELNFKQEFSNLFGPVTVNIYFYNDRQTGYGVTIESGFRTVTVERISKLDELKFE